MTQYKEANALVAEAAARGELPKITHENRAAFGLKQRQRRVDGEGWRAWVRVSKKGTGGITHESTTFHIATTELAPDGQPWPTHWSLDLFRNLSLGRELSILQFARRFDAESARFGFDLLSPVVGGKKPARARCHCCNREREHQWAKGLIDPHYDPNRCFAIERPGTKSGLTLARKAAIGLNAKLLERGIFRQCDPADYVNARTPLWFSCNCSEGGHKQLPSNVLQGCRPCQSAHRLPMANGANADGSIGRMGGLISGPITGAPFDSTWRVLRGERHPSENKPTCLYLHAVKGYPGLRVFGITNDPSGTPQHGTWYGDLIYVLWFERRSDAVLVESYFKDPQTGWLAQTPADLLGEEGASELTEGEPEDFINCATHLKDQLQRMGQQDFAAEFLVGVMA